LIQSLGFVIAFLVPLILKMDAIYAVSMLALVLAFITLLPILRMDLGDIQQRLGGHLDSSR
jgi:hypothetical protein